MDESRNLIVAREYLAALAFTFVDGRIRLQRNYDRFEPW